MNTNKYEEIKCLIKMDFDWIRLKCLRLGNPKIANNI